MIVGQNSIFRRKVGELLMVAGVSLDVRRITGGLQLFSRERLLLAVIYHARGHSMIVGISLDVRRITGGLQLLRRERLWVAAIHHVGGCQLLVA